MRSSPNSARYFGRTVILLALTSALCGFGLTGWHVVKSLPIEAGGQAPQPTGKGWLQVTADPIPTDDPTQIIACWWNLPQAGIGAASALVVSLTLALVLLAIVRRTTESALLETYRGQQRLRAALHYAVGWSIPLIPAGIILATLGLAQAARVGRWPIAPPAGAIYVPAAVLAGFAVIASWFGLLRLASTVPVPTRQRVVVYCGLVVPLLAAGLTAGAVWGTLWIQNVLSGRMQLQW